MDFYTSPLLVWTCIYYPYLYGLAHIGKTPAGLVAILLVIVDPAVSILGCVPKNKGVEHKIFQIFKF